MASRGNFRQPPTNEIPIGRILQVLPIVAILALVLYGVFNSYYTVDPNENAVVLRFGKPIGTVGPGLHFLIPIVDRAIPVDVKDRRIRLPFGVGEGDQDFYRNTNESAGLMLTGDQNAAVVEWDIQYRVNDPQQFLFEISGDHERLLQAAATSVMHRLVGDYSIDEVLTTERETIATRSRDALQELLDDYKSGIFIAGLNVQRVTPPESVKAAYDDVISAQQRKQALLSQAQRERNTIIPKAEAQADQLIQTATGEAQRRRLEIDGRIAALRAQYEAYQRAPDVTRRRMYLETMEEILSSNTGSKILVDGGLRGALPVLSLDGEGNLPTRGR